ncbi:Alpha/Beta hydrolase protein [Hysterangium stoloniferum]|nr:Alpha/Beta hydrolase protein [Hysterangium stoloniferum]
MPLCHIANDIALFYITNTPNDNVALFDTQKPTILLMHPVSLDVTWLRGQFKEPRLTNMYNMIAFDQRNSGRTKSTYSARRDSYVDAADVAFACELLQLPPVHVFAVQLNSIWAACRLSILFPSKCLSLCLCSLPTDIPLDWVPKAYQDLIELWSFPPDLETYEQAILEMSHFMFNGQIAPDLEDEIVAWWQINIPPRRRRVTMELTFGVRVRCPPSSDEYAKMRQPVLLMTGDRSVAHPLDVVSQTQERIPGSQLFVVRGAPEMFLILPQYTGITNRVFVDFLSRQPAPPPFTPTTPDVVKMAKEALVRLAEFRADPSIGKRDPCNPISFSMWPDEVVTQHQAILDQMAIGEAEALNPLDEKGIPLRKYVL